MEIKRNQPCLCGSGKRYKKCCSVGQQNSYCPGPPQASSLVIQGNTLQEKGDLEQALALYYAALEIDLKYSLAYFNIGGVFKKLERIEEAAASYEKALSLEPEDAEISVLLGALYTEMGKTKEAEASFKKALSCEQKTAEAYVKFGVFLAGFGLVTEALACYEKALLLKPESEEAYCSMGAALLLQGMVKEAVASFREAIALRQDYPKAQIFLSICTWISGDLTSCRNCLDQTFNTSTKIDKDETHFIGPYFYLLDKLLKYREKYSSAYLTKNDMPILHVIGDSHTLSMANIGVTLKGTNFLARAKIIIGCKAWHLGNNEINQYKYAFEKAIAAVPYGVQVVINIGEIDCRLNEGIIRKHNSTNNNLPEAISSLVGSYVEYITKTCATRKIKPLLCNIPGRLTGEDKISHSEKEMLETVLKKFNQALTDNCAARQIDLLDVNALSKNNDGTPVPECHLDNFHLLPSVFEQLLREA